MQTVCRVSPRRDPWRQVWQSTPQVQLSSGHTQLAGVPHFPAAALAIDRPGPTSTALRAAWSFLFPEVQSRQGSSVSSEPLAHVVPESNTYHWLMSKHMYGRATVCPG